METQYRRIKPTPTKIFFRYLNDKHSYLSNFYPSPMLIDNIMYYHVEGYYQSQKFIKDDHEHHVAIRSLVNPGDCKRKSREREMTQQRKQEWNDGLRLTIMRKAVLCKFLTNSDLGTKLLSTGNLELVEDAPWDSYWGDGGGKDGCNMLGKILMETRDILRNMVF